MLQVSSVLHSIAILHVKKTVSTQEETTTVETVVTSISIEELEQFSSTFHISERELIEIEKLSRTDMHLATSHFLRLASHHMEQKPKRMLVRKISELSGDTVHDYISETIIEVVKYGSIGLFAHFVDLSHVLPFLNDHIFETIGTVSLLSVLTLLAKKFSGKEE